MSRNVVRLLLLLILGLGLAGGLAWWELGQTPEPMSYDDIQEKGDYEKLINILLPTAKGVLERDGELAQPVAFGIELNDHMDFMEPEGSSTLESLQMIEREFKAAAHAGQLRCTAIAYDVERHEPGSRPSDAIEFRYEHVHGDAVKGWLSYRRIAPHQFQYGVIHFSRMAPDIFSHHNQLYGESD